VFGFLFVTTEGTDAKALWNTGLDVTTAEKMEICDAVPRCANRTPGGGWISVTVLTFLPTIDLPVKKNTVAKADYNILRDVGDDGTVIEFTNRLARQGSPPADLNLTVQGMSKRWGLVTDVWVKRKTGPPIEDCGDETDNDGDELVDCKDPDCGTDPECDTSAKSAFLRGDANDDGRMNIADPIWIIAELVYQGPRTQCASAADANDDGLEDLSDAMYLIQYQFLGGSKPSAPFLACGPDSTVDDLVCPWRSVVHCP
jgi:hypothetical protein